MNNPWSRRSYFFSYMGGSNSVFMQEMSPPPPTDPPLQIYFQFLFFWT